MSGRISYRGENMERVRGVQFATPALLLAKEEMTEEDEIDHYVSETIGVLKRRCKGCVVYVFLLRVWFN